MIPQLIKRIFITTGVSAALITLCICAAMPGAAACFAVAVCWALANLFVWTRLVLAIFTSGARHVSPVLGFLCGKLLLLAGGAWALYAASPFTRAEALAIIAGISLVFVVVALKALGARIAGVDLLAERRPEYAARKAGGEA
jgi:hypothetical protein